MGCSIFNDTIQLHVEGSNKDMDVLLQNTSKGGQKPKVTAGSALQNPELSKMSLTNMMKRVRQDAVGAGVSGQKNYWSAFLERTRSRCANGNCAETI